MAKGDDALRKKRNKVIRKRLRNSESSVSARVAAIIASKCRRKAGKRRICEGMCFSLPTEDDPFNERYEKKAMKKNKKSKKQKLNRRDNGQKVSDSALDADKKLQEKTFFASDTEKTLMGKPVEKTVCNGEAGGFENGSVCNKFLMLCLKAVEDAWVQEGTLSKGMVGALLSSSWGAEFCRVCMAGSSVVVTSEASATRDQVACLVSTAAGIVARKEKQGIIVANPFLLFLVSSQDRAIEVRSVCKPLKALGVHTVSLHSGTSLDHQVHGLKNCEPEFLVSTTERLLELVSLKAVDISGTSILVVDGLKKFVDLGLLDNLKSIRESISGDPQIITFSNSYGEMSVTVLLQHLIRGSVYWLSAHESVASTSTIISQYIHFYTLEEEKMSEVLQILVQALHNHTAKTSEVLLVSGSASKIKPLASYLNSKGYDFCGDSDTPSLHKANGEKSGTVLIKDLDNFHDLHMDKIEIVIIVDFPPSINDYIAILTKIARHTVVGVLHIFFSAVDAPLAQSLIDVLEQCGQVVPEFLKSLSTLQIP